jgi:hypothetical protein
MGPTLEPNVFNTRRKTGELHAHRRSGKRVRARMKSLLKVQPCALGKTREEGGTGCQCWSDEVLTFNLRLNNL